MTEFFPYAPTPKQAAFLLCMGEEAFYGGAAGGGKSDALLMAALQFVDVPGYEAILIRDTYANLSMPDALIDRSFKWLQGTSAHWNAEKKQWVFPSGARLSFGYLDGPRDHYNYQSAQFHFVGIDEVVNIRESQALYMFSRLRRRAEGIQVPLRFRAASNPPTRDQEARGAWVKRRWVDPKTKTPNAIFIPAWLSDNPHLDAESYKKNLERLDPITRKQLLEGDWEVRSKGNLFDRAWFRVLDEAPRPEDVELVVRYWDLAATEAKEGKNPAWTSGTKIARLKSKQYVILSVVRFRREPLETEQMIRQVADMDGKSVQIFMEQEPGSGGKNTIDHYRRQVLPDFSFRPDKVTGSKVERAAPLSSQAEGGNVFLVAGQWNEAFLDEAELFPFGEFKDQIDSAAGAYAQLAQRQVGLRIREA